MSDRVPDSVSDTVAGPEQAVRVAACPSRRAMLAAIPGAALLPGVLSACATEPPAPPSTEQQTADVPETTVPVADVPVGTARSVEVGSGMFAIVAQPTEGEFVAYSASCTHQGGIVQVHDDTRLRCPLHGAEYDMATGDVTTPPAPRPLDIVDVRVDGDTLVLS